MPSRGSIQWFEEVLRQPISLHIHGKRVESLSGFLPTPTGVALGVGLGTYGGGIGISITCDVGVLGEEAAQTILDLMLEEHREYLKQDLEPGAIDNAHRAAAEPMRAQCTPPHACDQPRLLGA